MMQSDGWGFIGFLCLLRFWLQAESHLSGFRGENMPLIPIPLITHYRFYITTVGYLGSRIRLSILNLMRTRYIKFQYLLWWKFVMIDECHQITLLFSLLFDKYWRKNTKKIHLIFWIHSSQYIQNENSQSR